MACCQVRSDRTRASGPSVQPVEAKQPLRCPREVRGKSARCSSRTKNLHPLPTATWQVVRGIDAIRPGPPAGVVLGDQEVEVAVLVTGPDLRTGCVCSASVRGQPASSSALVASARVRSPGRRTSLLGQKSAELLGQKSAELPGQRWTEVPQPVARSHDDDVAVQPLAGCGQPPHVRAVGISASRSSAMIVPQLSHRP